MALRTGGPTPRPTAARHRVPRRMWDGTTPEASSCPTGGGRSPHPGRTRAPPRPLRRPIAPRDRAPPRPHGAPPPLGRRPTAPGTAPHHPWDRPTPPAQAPRLRPTTPPASPQRGRTSRRPRKCGSIYLRICWMVPHVCPCGAPVHRLPTTREPGLWQRMFAPPHLGVTAFSPSLSHAAGTENVPKCGKRSQSVWPMTYSKSTPHEGVDSSSSERGGSDVHRFVSHDR